MASSFFCISCKASTCRRAIYTLRAGCHLRTLVGRFPSAPRNARIAFSFEEYSWNRPDDLQMRSAFGRRRPPDRDNRLPPSRRRRRYISSINASRKDREWCVRRSNSKPGAPANGIVQHPRNSGVSPAVPMQAHRRIRRQSASPLRGKNFVNRPLLCSGWTNCPSAWRTVCSRA